MQYNRVMSLANGTCIKIDNSLTCRVKSIAFELEKDKKYEDHISISNARELLMDGTAYSDNNRVIIKNPIFRDKIADISFTIDTMDLSDGDIIKGTISFVTNVGNADIPFEYNVIANNIDRAIAKLNEVVDYYDLLNSDFRIGRELFTDKRILKAKFMQNDWTRGLYDGLIRSSNTDIALIEFFKAFELDITNLFKGVEDEVLNRYIYDSLNDIELEEIKNNRDLNRVLLTREHSVREETITNEVTEEANSLIDNLRDKELLTVLASMCVRGNFTDEISFKIMLKVIEKGSNINGIYDKFLLSIPDDYGYKFPLYIYRYYYDDKNYSFDDKSKLYENIIAAFEESDDVYKMYNAEILEYAISRIYQNKITESLIKIYNKVLSINIINENNADNILYLLRNHKIVIHNRSIKKVIIKYAETEKETKYDVVNGIAYVPIFFESRIMLYEDVYGNRYYYQNAVIKVLFDKKDLESYIIENYPQKDIIDMTKIIKLNEAQTINRDYEVDEIRSLESKINISQTIKSSFKKKIIDYYFRTVTSGNAISESSKVFLMKLLFSNMDILDKRKILKVLFECGEYQYVYNKVSFYGRDLLEVNDLKLLFSKMIDLSYENRTKLLNDIFEFVKDGFIDNKLINYLVNNYESSIKNMILIMDIASKENIDTSFIAKKILMIALESDEVEELDHIFNNYNASDDEDNHLVIAYLNKKATDYVLDNKETSDEYFEKLTKYLLENIEELEDVPIVFLFAITKYISTFKLLSNNDLRRVLIKAMDRLLDTEYVFAYYKKLNAHIRMPYHIMNKEYIEYHADKDFVPKASITISGSDDVKTMELNKVFMNIYVKKITVFKNEVINYEIFNANDPSEGVLAKGTLTYDDNYETEHPKNNRTRSTYDFINDAIVNLDRDNIEGLKKVVMEITEKQEISKELFNI